MLFERRRERKVLPIKKSFTPDQSARAKYMKQIVFLQFKMMLFFSNWEIKLLGVDAALAVFVMGLFFRERIFEIVVTTQEIRVIFSTHPPPPFCDSRHVLSTKNHEPKNKQERRNRFLATTATSQLVQFPPLFGEKKLGVSDIT